MAYGWQQQPTQDNIIFRNATVWTNEDVGTIDQADVAISQGKIVKVGVGIVAEEIFKKERASKK